MEQRASHTIFSALELARCTANRPLTQSEQNELQAIMAKAKQAASEGKTCVTFDKEISYRVLRELKKLGLYATSELGEDGDGMFSRDYFFSCVDWSNPKIFTGYTWENC